MMIMVKGRPSGAIILASGSTFGLSIGVYYLGKLAMGENTTSRVVDMQQRGPPYTAEVSMRLPKASLF